MSAIKACRSCGSGQLTQLLDLGRTPLANALPTEAELGGPEETVPLVLVFCEQCALVQITETVSPEKLFREYAYFSSFSDAMVNHARVLVERLVSERRLDASSLAAEIASNDGYLLQHYVKAGVPALGIEPARNIAKVAIERGVPTVAEFFGAPLAKSLAAEGKQADVVHANNVMAHVADINGFVAGLATLLKPGGVASLESPYVRRMVEHLEFDTIYHEHLYYYSMTSLASLFERHGLAIVDVEELPIHGGTIRTFVSRLPAQPNAKVRTMLEEERQVGLDRCAYYASFAARVAALKVELRAELEKWKAGGKRLAAYGASAKGSTLLNYCGIGRETLDFVVDRSNYKQGRFMPGVHLPIHPPSRLIEEKPDGVLLLTWNFADEILAQQRDFRATGGKFIVPVPSVRVV